MAQRHDRPAQAPGSNFVEPRFDDQFDEATFLTVLAETAEALQQKGIPHLFMGGVSSAAYGRPRWTRDIDVFVRPEDAGLALDALAASGFRTEQTYPDWLYKAWKDGVDVDVVFSSTGGILLDDEMLERAAVESYLGTDVPVLPPEDLLVIKALAHDEHMPRHWHDGLAVVARSRLDWDYLVRRARRHGARRVLSLLLYAQSNDLVVPNGPVRALFEEVFADWPEPGPRGESEPVMSDADAYVAERVRTALAEDPRVGELGIAVSVEDGRLVLTGEVATPERRAAVEAVAREEAPGREIDNRVSALALGGPGEPETLG